MILRLWKLGSLEHKVVPTADNIKTLEEKLAFLFSSGKGTVDLVWGPDLTLEVHEIGEGVGNLDKIVYEPKKEE